MSKSHLWDLDVLANMKKLVTNIHTLGNILHPIRVAFFILYEQFIGIFLNFSSVPINIIFECNNFINFTFLSFFPVFFIILTTRFSGHTAFILTFCEYLQLITSRVLCTHHWFRYRSSSNCFITISTYFTHMHVVILCTFAQCGRRSIVNTR